MEAWENGFAIHRYYRLKNAALRFGTNLTDGRKLDAKDEDSFSR